MYEAKLDNIQEIHPFVSTKNSASFKNSGGRRHNNYLYNLPFALFRLRPLFFTKAIDTMTHISLTSVRIKMPPSFFQNGIQSQ